MDELRKRVAERMHETGLDKILSNDLPDFKSLIFKLSNRDKDKRTAAELNEYLKSVSLEDPDKSAEIYLRTQLNKGQDFRNIQVTPANIANVPRYRQLHDLYNIIRDAKAKIDAIDKDVKNEYSNILLNKDIYYNLDYIGFLKPLKALPSDLLDNAIKRNAQVITYQDLDKYRGRITLDDIAKLESTPNVKYINVGHSDPMKLLKLPDENEPEDKEQRTERDRLYREKNREEINRKRREKYQISKQVKAVDKIKSIKREINAEEIKLRDAIEAEDEDTGYEASHKIGTLIQKRKNVEETFKDKDQTDDMDRVHLILKNKIHNLRQYIQRHPLENERDKDTRLYKSLANLKDEILIYMNMAQGTPEMANIQNQVYEAREDLKTPNIPREDKLIHYLYIDAFRDIDKASSSKQSRPRGRPSTNPMTDEQKKRQDRNRAYYLKTHTPV